MIGWASWLVISQKSRTETDTWFRVWCLAAHFLSHRHPGNTLFTEPTTLDMTRPRCKPIQKHKCTSRIKTPGVLWVSLLFKDKLHQQSFNSSWSCWSNHSAEIKFDLDTKLQHPLPSLLRVYLILPRYPTQAFLSDRLIEIPILQHRHNDSQNLISSRPITRWNLCIMWWERGLARRRYIVDLPKFRDTRLRRNTKMLFSYSWAWREAERSRLLALIVRWVDMGQLLFGGGKRSLKWLSTCISCWVWCRNKFCGL